VDVVSCCFGNGLWKEHIAFEKVDLIVLGENRRVVERQKMLLNDEPGMYKVRSKGSVVMGQLLIGGALSVAGGFVGALAGLGADQGSGNGDAFFIPAGPIIGAASGVVLGSAFGVSLVSKGSLEKPAWGRALGGSLIGFGLALKATSASDSLWPTLFIAPPVFATVLSWVGNSPKYNNVKIHVGLLLTGGQGVSAAYSF
jgi:hypothetical protein